jgi:Fibronectin type III domain
MARFPIGEAQIVALAKSLVNGLEVQASDFPHPPAAVDELQAALEEFQAAMTDAVQARAAAKRATEAKMRARAVLVDLLKSDIKYAESIAQQNPLLLKGLGWGGRRKRTKRKEPGQPMGLEIVREDVTAIALRWKKPVSGGDADAYEVERRKQGATWAVVGSTVNLEIVLDNQERGVDLEFRVRAENKAGKSPPSHTVRAVL